MLALSLSMQLVLDDGDGGSLPLGLESFRSRPSAVDSSSRRFDGGNGLV